MTPAPRSVVIDTDPGIDDALALMLALRAPSLPVELVTTVAGNVHVELASANARRVLALVQPAAVPVLAQGAARGLRRPMPIEGRVHGADGLGGLSGLRRRDGAPRYGVSDAPPVRAHAAARIARMAEHHGAGLTIVALGPLTNIARAVEQRPDAMRRVGHIVVMGGAVRVPGNVSAAAEFNIHADPHAARVVFDAGLSLTLVPLDVTRRVRLTPAFLSSVLGTSRTPAAQAVRHMAAHFLRRAGGAAGMALHDPLAVAVAIDPALVTLTPMTLAVETRGRHTSGMTLVQHEPAARRRPGVSIRVATAVDAERVLELFAEHVLVPETRRRRAGETAPGVIVLGSANTDFTVWAGRLPRPGETVLGADLHTGFGGKGANQAVAARRAGARVHFVGALGGDDHGTRYRQHLGGEGIDLSALGRRDDTGSGAALIVVDARGRNQIAVAPGANARVAPADLDALTPLLEGARVLGAQLETPLATVEEALRRAKRRGLVTVLNAAPAATLPRRLSRVVDVLVVNELEAQTLLGEPGPRGRSPRESVAALLERGYASVVVTLGARGVAWSDGGGLRRLSAHRVAALDTTGAGDAFVGYLLCALARARTLADAVVLANAAAALAVGGEGAQASIPVRGDVERLLRRARRKA